MRITALSPLIAVVSLSLIPLRAGRAQAEPSAPCDADSVRQRVCAVDDSLGMALIRRDTSALARLYSDDLATINYRGVRSSKAAIIAAVGAGRLRFDRLQPSQRAVTLRGDTAVLTERMHQVATGLEGRHPEDVDYRRTYVLRADRWQLVAAVIGVAPK